MLKVLHVSSWPHGEMRYHMSSMPCFVQDYIKAVSSFNLDAAFPNMDSHAYDFRVDKYEPNRVWFTIRNTGTHTGPLKFLGRTIQPTGKVCSCWTAYVPEFPHKSNEPASVAPGALSTVKTSLGPLLGDGLCIVHMSFLARGHVDAYCLCGPQLLRAHWMCRWCWARQSASRTLSVQTAR